MGETTVKYLGHNEGHMISNWRKTWGTLISKISRCPPYTRLSVYTMNFFQDSLIPEAYDVDSCFMHCLVTFITPNC